MLKYYLKEYHDEAKQTGCRLGEISGGAINCESKILGRFETFQAGQEELKKYTSTVKKNEGVPFSTWSFHIFLMEEMELLNPDEPDKENNWVHTGRKWITKLEFNGRKYYLEDIGRGKLEDLERYISITCDLMTKLNK